MFAPRLPVAIQSALHGTRKERAVPRAKNCSATCCNRVNESDATCGTLTTPSFTGLERHSAAARSRRLAQFLIAYSRAIFQSSAVVFPRGSTGAAGLCTRHEYQPRAGQQGATQQSHCPCHVGNTLAADRRISVWLAQSTKDSATMALAASCWLCHLYTTN